MPESFFYPYHLSDIVKLLNVHLNIPPRIYHPSQNYHTNGDIIVGRRNGNGRDGLATPHPTLIGGRNPEVAMASMLHIHGGKIASYDNNSGHFKPNSQSMSVADAAFSKLPSNLFKKRRGE